MSEPFPVDQVEPVVGTALGAYRLEQVLEQRYPARSFLARDHQTQQTYHVWVLSLPDLSPEDRAIYLGLFQREAGRLAALEHPGLLALHDYGIAQGIPYLVYASSPAQSLSTLLARRGPLNLALAGQYLEQLASTLEYAHQQGLWHLNLTTDCLLWQERGDLVIAELGLVRILAMGAKLHTASVQSEGHETFKGMRDVHGKPLYGLSNASAPAPELLLASSVGAPTDVYGLGAVLYRMLTGHRVFRGSTPDELAKQTLNQSVPPLSRWRSDLNPALDAVLAKAMARDQTQRFQRPESLATAYTQLVAPPGAVHVQPLSQAPLPLTVEPSTEAVQPLIVPRPTPTLRRGSSAVSDRSASTLTRRRLVILLGTGAGAVAAVTVVTLFARRSFAGNVSSVGTPGALPTGATGSSGGASGTPVSQGKVLARTSDLPLNSSKAFPLAGSANPGVLIHLPDARFVAFDSTCTHQGCEVAYSAADHLLKCPCHGAIFDPTKGAAVVQGPATSPLTTVPITVQSNGTITSGA